MDPNASTPVDLETVEVVHGTIHTEPGQPGHGPGSKIDVTPEEAARLEADGAVRRVAPVVEEAAPVPPAPVSKRKTAAKAKAAAAKAEAAPAQSGDGPPAGDDLILAVAEVIASPAALDPETDFTADGPPRVDALERELGYGITEADRDAAWALHNEKSADGGADGTAGA